MKTYWRDSTLGQKVIDKLNRYAGNLSPHPDALTDAQKWHKFQTNPSGAIAAVPPAKRDQFLQEMQQLGQKYKNRAGGG